MTALLASLIGVLVLLLLMLLPWHCYRRTPSAGGPRVETLGVGAVDLTLTEEPESDAKAVLASTSAPGDLVGLGQIWYAEGRPEPALRAYHKAAEQSDAKTVERAAAYIGEAQALFRLGEKSQALGRLLETERGAEEIPEAWAAYARRVHAVVMQAEAGSPMPALAEVFCLDGMAGPEAGSATAELPRIEIDTQTYVLTVHTKEQTLGPFPVGLGRGGSTPAGDFVIANKIKEPDWYDRGRVVKAGDPENPLGASWMGLGRDGQATSYGIHPTDEPEAIGRDASRGCIRMLPEDAALVFEACPIGTRVHIGP